MAQFRTTADLVDTILQNGGEVTNGNSPYEAQVLGFLNRVHFSLVAGGTIPVGKDLTVEIDEVWPWAKAKGPLVLELLPKYDTGTVTLTLGSEAGTFSSAPAISLQGYHFNIPDRSLWYKIASHTAGATAFELDGSYESASSAGLTYKAVKLDYMLIPSYIVINDGSNKIQFQKAAGTTLTGTLTNGTYTPSDLATAVATAITAAAGGPTVTGAYSSTTRKFTFTSNLAGPTIFRIDGAGDLANVSSVHKALGFDDETTSSATAQTSTYVRGGIARLIEPFRLGDGIFGVDSESFHREFPFGNLYEGTPNRFCVVCESSDGTLTVRFNAYPTEKTRVEVEHVPVPRDLKDSASSIPLVPRKHNDVLEDAGTFYLMLLKSDDRMQVYSSLMQGKLNAMIAQHRGSLVRSGEFFGQIVPRPEQLGRRRRLFPSEPY